MKRGGTILMASPASLTALCRNTCWCLGDSPQRASWFGTRSSRAQRGEAPRAGCDHGGASAQLGHVATSRAHTEDVGQRCRDKGRPEHDPKRRTSSGAGRWASARLRLRKTWHELGSAALQWAPCVGTMTSSSIQCSGHSASKVTVLLTQMRGVQPGGQGASCGA